MLLDSAVSAQAIVDRKGAAESAGLRYVSDARPGIRRKKAGKGFTYIRADGSKLCEADVLKRIKALAIPPAWTGVWICPLADGHIQADIQAAQQAVELAEQMIRQRLDDAGRERLFNRFIAGLKNN